MLHVKLYYSYNYDFSRYVFEMPTKKGGEEVMKKFFLIMLSLLIAISLTLSIGCQKAKEQAGEVKEKATETAGEVKEKAAETAEQVKEKAAETAGEVKEKAAETAEQVKEKAGATKK
jgi:preprotein translocase subunit SecG